MAERNKNMNSNQFCLRKRMRSFIYAARGIKQLATHEHNMWIHMVAAVCVIVAGFVFNITQMEWIAIILCIGLVMAAEGFNTAIEKIADYISPDWMDAIGKIKDIAAGAVLICAATAAIIGLIVFTPYLIAL